MAIAVVGSKLNTSVPAELLWSDTALAGIGTAFVDTTGSGLGRTEVKEGSSLLLNAVDDGPTTLSATVLCGVCTNTVEIGVLVGCIVGAMFGELDVCSVAAGSTWLAEEVV